MTLKDIAIFKLKPLVANFNAKISAATENNTNSQILCLVHANNDLFLRYTNYENPETHTDESPGVTVKLLPWFSEHGKVVQAVCFEPTNERLLVLCDDNTLHVIPSLAIVQEEAQQAESKATTTASHSTTTTTTSTSSQTITSYIIPFVGPHECPNPRTCPNNFYRPPNLDLEHSLKTTIAADLRQPPTLDELYSKQSVDRLLSARDGSSTYFNECTSSAAVAEDKESQQQQRGQTGTVCPYPTAVVWWQTKRRQDRAIVGYSDGSVCFLSLTPNCPFIANTTLSDAVQSFDICRDTSGQTVTLLINTSKNTQWKLLLEEEQSRYIFPGDSPTTVADNNEGSSRSGDYSRIAQDWQFVVTAPTSSGHSSPAMRADPLVPKLFPGGISYLREIGTRKIGALKQRLAAAEKATEKEPVVDPPLASNPTAGKPTMTDDDDDEWGDEPAIGTFVDVLETPSVSPEMITSAQGPKIVVKNHNTRSALFALHHETVSVHNLNMDPEPFSVYCLPDNCQDVLVTQNTIYTVQKVTAGQRNGRVGVDGAEEEVVVAAAAEGLEDTEVPVVVVACGVVSKTLAIKNKESDSFEDRALVTYFPFHAENVINLHGQFTRQASPSSSGRRNMGGRREVSPAEKRPEKQQMTVRDYVKQRAQFEGGGQSEGGNGNERVEVVNEVRILETAFPPVHFESCFVVTDKNTYAVELNEAPETIFMNFAKQSMWSSCKYFCDIFNISMAQCIEYCGDELLRQHKVTQALFTYNVAQIPPIKTALKLATYGESNALLHLCAMALKCIYVLKSSRPSGAHAQALLQDLPLRTIPPKRSQSCVSTGSKKKSVPEGDLNVGQRCSDFSYDHDEVGMDMQMSFSSQFHLSNLMFLTLCEKTLTEKNYYPLWSFVQVNQRFHTSLASTMLAQGGLYSTAVLLAKVRGAGLDVFVALVRAMRQELGTDLNYLMYNLSEAQMFRECVTYLSAVAIDYFEAVAGQRERFSVHVVDRLVEQLNPFAACFRPIVSRLSAIRHEHRRGQAEDEEHALFPVYCRSFVEAFLAVLVRSVEMRVGGRSELLNGLRSINIRYEANLGLMGSGCGWQRVDAGYAHACRVVDGKAFIWGSNQMPYVVDDNLAMAPGIESSSLGSQPKMVKFLANLSVTVLSVHCGRTHTLLHTNNGLYSMGGNSLGQLGVGSHVSQSLHPVLVETLMDMHVELIAVGQYHNAVVANGRVYVWGWGVYGQLGNGGIEDVQVPTVLHFFDGKKIKQIALGHVHSLVLCEGAEARLEDLYVFGSNYFGQLGTGQTPEQGEEKGMSKALVPIKLDLNERIRCIHTTFFVNFAVTESNELLTWGASPQALRVINQARKRARSQIRSELAKEKEAALEKQSSEEGAADQSKENESSVTVPEEEPASCTINAPTKKEHRPKIEAKKSRRHSLSNLTKLKASRRSPGRLQRSPSDESLPKRPAEAPPSSSSSLKRRSERSPDTQKLVLSNVPAESSSKTLELSDLDEWTEHLRPTKVDTSNVEEEDILEVSSGLYHFALRTSHGVYTWGKNIEKQLGNDSSRADVPIPTQLEAIKRPLSVHCGADFTLVLVQSGGGGGEEWAREQEEESLLAFGNNNMGQCGRETGEKSALMGKWVRLKISKRHIRIPDGSACVSAPTEVVFGGGAGEERRRGGDHHQVAPIKSLPQFKSKFFVTSRYLSELGRRQQEEQEEKMDSGPEEEKEEDQRNANLVSALKSLKLGKPGSEEENTDELAMTPPDEDDDDEDNDEEEDEERLDGRKRMPKKCEGKDHLRNGLPVIFSSSSSAAEFIHYCLYLFYGIYDTETVAEKCAFAEFRVRLKMLQSKFFEAFQIALREVDAAAVSEGEKVRQSLVLLEFFTKDENLIPMHEEDLKYFIQEIFVFFIEREWDLEPLEGYFRSQLSLYVIPLAYVLFFDVAATPTELDLSGDGTEMAMMGGGSGAKQLRDSVLLKYRTFFNHLECAPQKYRVTGASGIFERVSVVFNALICQRVVEIFEQVVDGG